MSGSKVVIGSSTAGREVVVNSDGSINTGVPNTSINTRRLLVTPTPQQITTQLSNRKVLRVVVLGNSDVYLGASNSVASGDGWPVFSNTWQDFSLGADIQPYIMQSVGTGDIRLMEVS